MMQYKKIKLSFGLYILLQLAGTTLLAQSVWREAGFADFRDGSFLDAGSNAYVSARGRIQMISSWDYNGDGNLDVILPPGHGQTEKENTFIYLNSGQDIDARSRIELPGCGSRDGLVADFNRDGWNDLAVANHRDSHVGWVDTWIYYGGEKGFSAERRDALPAYMGTALAAGDFNSDGWLDLAIACKWQEGDEENPQGPEYSFIYWNSPAGFARDRRLPLTFDQKGAHAVAAGDLDGDQVTDLAALTEDRLSLLLSGRKAFDHPEGRVSLPVTGSALAIGDVNADGRKDLAVCGKGAVNLFFGTRWDSTIAPSVVLTAATPRDVALADIDRDGKDDVIVANFASAGGATWTDSYIFYSDGKDFSSRKPLTIPTLGATGVSAGDLNGDGWPELVFSHEWVTNESSLLSYVYWNQGGQFCFGNHTQLPTEGAAANAIGDVNRDGKPDVIFFNTEGGLRDGPSTAFIYWGDGSRNFSAERRLDLPMHQIFGTGAADLDDDGRVDLILAQAKFVLGVDHTQSGLILYWGQEKGFALTSHLTMQTGYGGMRIADINRDGYLDILAGGHCVDLADHTKFGFPIFWGSPEGFRQHNRTVLHIDGYRMRAPLLMDLNKDGWLDIAGQAKDGKVKFWWGRPEGFSNTEFSELDLGRNDHLMYIQGADFDKDGWLDLLFPHRGPPDGTETTSLIYYGAATGYTRERSVEIPCYVTYQNSIADFDKDGWLDLFLCSYGGEVQGNRPSLLYYGGPEGFLKRPRAELPSYGSSGSQASDFDGDGWLDLLITNHRKSGSYIQPEPHRHTCPSMLYWGGPQGFSTDRCWQANAYGPSGLNVRDPGNSYDRGLYEEYFSSAHDIPPGQIPRSIAWEAETPHGTAVQFQIRTAATEAQLAAAPWHGPGGEKSWFTWSGAKITKTGGGWIQYRARLSTPNGAATPVLTSVSIDFR
jgi:hypothetical protein